MAEVMEGVKNEVPSKAKVNAALTTGIIGTSLSGIMALGALGLGSGFIGKYGFKQDFHYTLRKIKKYINKIIMNDPYIIELSDNILEQ